MNGYVLDKKGGIADPIKRLDLGAATSRSFNGISSAAGNEAQAGTARESFLFDFGTTANDQHSRVVTAYTNLVTNAPNNSRLATNILGLDDTQADHQFRPNFYKGDSPNSLQVHEGVIPVDAQNNPLFLVAAKAAGGINDRFIYGTNRDDEFRLSGSFAKYYNNNGNHTYNVGNGNDLVFGGIGNDIIFGGAGNDTVDGGDGNNLVYGDDGNDILGAGIGNDTLHGGSGIDIIDGGDGTNDIYGDRGNDYLTGGNGTNRLFGGGENDVLEGGTGLNLLKGTETNMMSGNEVDTLIGNPSARLNAFYIGDRAINWYSANGLNDYAYIVNFNPVTDIILGGVNIEAQNLITQTFLWAGGELIAKIEGLWASQLQFPVRIF
ncbi:MAG: calcium-binding protein [Oscillatoriales cyanobacterium]|nr:MAG: calcium-binding protein [Oscillatoriales cyanobacterium]